MSNKWVNFICYALAIVSFFLILYAGWINIHGSFKEAMLAFYSAFGLSVIAVFILLLKRNDW